MRRHATVARVSVIVASYNRAADLRRSLQAIVDSTFRDVELIVVDNASHDDAVAVAASFEPAHLIRNQDNRGFAGANNQGLEVATGDYVALVNNDAVIAADWLARHVDFLEQHPQAAAVGGKLHLWDDDHRLGDSSSDYYGYATVDSCTAATRTELNPPDDVREVATLSGAAVVIRRTAIDDVGPPFLEPEFFTYYEETDFFARALRRGWRLYYTGLPAAWHRVRASTAKEPYRYFYYMERNRLLFAYRHWPVGLLQDLLRQARRDTLREAKARPVRWLAGMNPEARARRDARWWVVRHRAKCHELRHRARGGDRNYLEALAMIEARTRYYDHARPEIAALIPAGARTVVDVGCAGGALGAALKASRPGVRVYGVEPAPQPAARARERLDAVLVGEATDPLPDDWPAPDCVVFADVLEHLVDPWAVLRLWKARLAPGGCVVLSVPNVAHGSVATGLLHGRWRYADAGILDRTHLRFFTRATAIELVERADLQLERLERVVDGRSDAWWRRQAIGRAQRGGAGPVAQRIADWHTVQFLLVAR